MSDKKHDKIHGGSFPRKPVRLMRSASGNSFRLEEEKRKFRRTKRIDNVVAD